MPRVAWLVLSVVLLGAYPGRVVAIVSIDIPHERLQERGRALSLAGTFSGHSGNGPGITAGGALLGAIKPGRHLVLLRLSGEYSEFEDAITASGTFVHLRHQRELNSWLLTDLFLQGQSDRFQRLNARRLLGAGPAFVLTRSKRIIVRAGTGIMYEKERYRLEPGSGDPESADALRSTSYLSLSVKAARGVGFSVFLYFQPLFQDLADSRILSENTLNLIVNSRLTSRLGLTVRHDSRPPSGVKKTDIEITHSLGISL